MNPLLFATVVFLATAATPAPAKAVSETDLERDPTISSLSQKIDGLQDLLADAIRHTKHPQTDRGVKTIRQKIQKLEDELDNRKAELGWRPWRDGPSPPAESPGYFLPLPLAPPRPPLRFVL